LPLAGKRALITGASRGIGRTIALVMAEAGAAVAVTARSLADLQTLAAEVEAKGGRAYPVVCDVADPKQVGEMVTAVQSAFGGVDILVNNAATNPHFGPLLTAEESQWDKTFDVNVKGYMRMIQACVPAMVARGGGKIINLASIAGLRGQPGMGVYAVTKAGVLMLTQVLAEELAFENIQINAIAPGFINTRFSQAIWSNPAINEAILKAIPQQRMAEPEELTGIALYLASPASSFTTGATFTVDGGQMAGSGVMRNA
jgi:NAD(P)-dependent dehydrogenase (short-subunit alcohol dehydrogenase family)